MLSNAYPLAKIGFDAAENEPAKNLQQFAKIFLILLISLGKICHDPGPAAAGERHVRPAGRDRGGRGDSPEHSAEFLR